MSNEVKQVLEKLDGDQNGISALADTLGYVVGLDPILPESENRVLFHKDAPDKSIGVITVIPKCDLTKDSTTIEVRRLFKEVISLREKYGSTFNVSLVFFLGVERLVVFKYANGNRDERLDLNDENADKGIYLSNFKYLQSQNVTIEEDEFGFGSYTIEVDFENIFKRELTAHFLHVIAYYRKKMSELITGTSLKNELEPLLTERAKFFLNKRDTINLIEEESYRIILSNVVDTIILRQLMRRFLEGYYGPQAFEMSNISLGVGKGTLDEAIKKAVDIAVKVSDENTIKQLNERHVPIREYNEMDLFADFFDDEDAAALSQVKLKPNSKEKLAEYTKKAKEQFETVYGGDLFAGSIGQISNKIEERMAVEASEFLAKLWVDTASGNYSFRYEDMAPNALEAQYEASMSQNVQLKINEGKPEVYYDTDFQEQKSKGAYYTDDNFVKYMVSETLDLEFERRRNLIKEAIKTGDINQIEVQIEYLLNLKCADLTSGGGSFLRGLFQTLANKQLSLVALNIPEVLLEKYPYFSKSDNAVYKWEKYILEHMIYGVDIDYKAVMIASLTLTLSSLEHRPSDELLPSLIGKTLIHQNSLMNAVPLSKRSEVFAPLEKDIKELRELKYSDFGKFEKKRQELQQLVTGNNQGELGEALNFLHVESIELNLPEVFFDKSGKLLENSGFDVIVGNPPWEKWKPNSNEFFSAYDSSYLDLENKAAKEKRQKELVQKFPNIENKWVDYQYRISKGSEFFRSEDNYQWQKWKVNGKTTGGDINLYKIAIERFTQLTKQGGLISILVEDSLMIDEGASGLRHLLFDEYTMKEFLSFENRKKIFKAVDSRYKFAVLTFKKEKSEIENFDIFFYRTDLQDLYNDHSKMKYDLKYLRKTNPELLTPIQARDEEQYSVYNKCLSKFEAFGNSNLFSFRTDFHKTNDKNFFNTPKIPGEVPLWVGQNIDQFSIVSYPNESVNKVDVGKKTGAFEDFRIAFRRIASATNKRTMIATLLPRNATATNSLYIQREDFDVSLEDRIIYVSLLNSYVVDFQIRQIVSSTVLVFMVKSLVIPKSSDLIYRQEILDIGVSLLLKNGEEYEELRELVTDNRYIEMDRKDLEARLNAIVALEYELSREDILILMKSFLTPNHAASAKESFQEMIEMYDDFNKEINKK